MIFIVESFINCLSSWGKCYVLLLWRYMTYMVSICLSSQAKQYVLWLWRYMTYVVSILVVASYYGIICILVMSICIEPGRWESHITISECSWARSVRKLYDYSGVLLWIMSLTYGQDRTGTHRTLPEEGCDVKVDMHCICTFEVLSYWSLMLAWSGYEEYSFHLYEKYRSIHRWISFIYCISWSLHVYGNFIG
jgi:hypothetical protein